MKFKQLIGQNRFTLVVSLPENSLALAKAAIEGGASAVKVHANVWHRASGHTFGSFSENRAFLKDLVALAGDVPVGLVPGADEAFVSVEERDEMQALGIDFFSSYLHHLPCYMMDTPAFSRMGAIDCTYNELTLEGVNATALDVLECSIQPGESYGQKLTYADILRYAAINQRVNKPTLIPTQKDIHPAEVRHLYEAGCKAVMVGASCMGKEPTPDEVRRVLSAFAENIAAL